MRVLLLLLFFASHALISLAQLDASRAQYFNAGMNDDARTNYYNLTRSLNESIAIERAYKGVASAMYAAVLYNPADKLSHFDQGKTWLESAIEMDKWNPEIRFLRFCVQANAPFMLGYDDNLEDDANIILQGLESGRCNRYDYYWKNAVTFMINSDELSSSQEQRIAAFK